MTQHKWEEEKKEEMAKYAKLMYDRHLVSAAGGNLSMKLGPDRFLVTAGNASLRELSREDMLICSRTSDRGSDGRKPSKE